MKIQIILGSTREGRVGERVAKWVAGTAAQIEGFEVELVDLAGYELPMFNEAISPRYNPNRTPDAEAKRYMDKLAEADGYVFVTPEYNHSLPAALKNSFDYLDSQLSRKVSAIVSYGTVGGARAAEHLKLVLLEAGSGVVPQAVAVLGSPSEIFSADGKLDSEIAAIPYGPAGALLKTLGELAWWAGAAKAARDEVATV